MRFLKLILHNKLSVKLIIANENFFYHIHKYFQTVYLWTFLHLHWSLHWSNPIPPLLPCVQNNLGYPMSNAGSSIYCITYGMHICKWCVTGFLLVILTIVYENKVMHYPIKCLLLLCDYHSIYWQGRCLVSLGKMHAFFVWFIWQKLPGGIIMLNYSFITFARDLRARHSDEKWVNANA